MHLFTFFPAMVPFFFILLGLGLAGTMIWHKHKAELARTAAMEQWANSLGYSFSATDSFGLAKQLQDFELFKRERSRWINKGKIRNILRSLVGETEVYLFDYTYTVQAGKSRKAVTQTVFFANDKQWFLPDFHLKPENWWHKLQAKLGMSSDINFEENPEFSEKFWLQGQLEPLIRQQFTPQLQGFMCEKPPAHLEGKNYYLIGYKPKKRLAIQDAQVFFEHCCEIVQMLQEKGKMELLDLAELKEQVTVELGNNSAQ